MVLDRNRWQTLHTCPDFVQRKTHEVQQQAKHNFCELVLVQATKWTLDLCWKIICRFPLDWQQQIDLRGPTNIVNARQLFYSRQWLFWECSHRYSQGKPKFSDRNWAARRESQNVMIVSCSIHPQSAVDFAACPRQIYCLCSVRPGADGTLTLARATGGSDSFSAVAAFSYSGASRLQWPHLKKFVAMSKI